MRICPKCKIKKLLNSENFYRNKTEIGGFQYTCKDCHKTHYKRENNENYYNPQKNLEYKNNRYNTDIEYKLLIILRNRINQYLRKGNHECSIDFLGCSIDQYKKHIESNFTTKMNWDNYGIYWEIDHIVPLSKGGSFHYTNTQPLTITENRKKSNKTIF